jgi:D-alanine transaminase
MRRLKRSELQTAEEVFITSSSRMIVPVVRVDGVPVGGGRPSPYTRRLMEAFDAYTRGLAAAARPPAGSGVPS